jgi:hypothetical protein
MVKRVSKPMHLFSSHMPRTYCKEGHPASYGNPTPHTMTAINLQADQRDMIHKQALDIFTTMANAGNTFSDCLGAILLSGINWGSNAERAKHD